MSMSFIGIYTDIRHRTISNFFCFVVLLSSTAYGFLYGDFSIPLLRMIGVLLVGFILFSLSIVGAGDVKLLSAYSLGVSPEYWWLTIFLILILGAILALSYLVYGILTNKMNEVKARGLPYGIPITLASVFGIWLSSL